MTKYVYKKGRGWEEGQASPALLREDLRVLPGELVTNDIIDGKKIHDLDPPHIVEALKADYEKEQAAPTKPQDLIEESRRPAAASVPLTQDKIDWIRLSVAKARIMTNWYLMRDYLKGERGDGVISTSPQLDLGVKHLWFPKDDLNEYSCLEGNPPPDCDRPKHLRGLKLWVDLHNPIPESLARTIESDPVRKKFFDNALGKSMTRSLLDAGFEDNDPEQYVRGKGRIYL